MKLTDILSETRVVPGLEAEDKDGVLRELVRRGFLEGQTPGLDADDEERVVSVLLAREQLGSTGIRDGLAIPHGKLPDLDGLTAALGIAKAGVDFGALDGEPSRVFIVLLSPEGAGGDHLKALARISRLFSQSNLQRRIVDKIDATEIFSEIATEDARF